MKGLTKKQMENWKRLLGTDDEGKITLIHEKMKNLETKDEKNNIDARPHR